MNRRAPRPLARALESLTATLAPQTPLGAVQGAWEEVVGASIAAHGTPVTEHGGVLDVVCDEAVWASELDLMGPDLVVRLNAALGRPAITALRCRVGNSQAAKRLD